jgi:hypothetical protein
MDDRQNLSQPESVITTTEKSPSRNLQKKTCTALEFIAEGLTVIFESTQSLMGGV